jgi:hypothetical protein
MCYQGFCSSARRQCSEKGLDEECAYDSHVYLNSWKDGDDASKEPFFCSTLWCSSAPSQCTYFLSGGQAEQVADGVPCSLDGGKQCLNKECVPSGDLNLDFKWMASEWSPCSECFEEQNRTVFCAFAATGAPSNSLYCSTNSKPGNTQLCENATLACVYNQEYSEGELDLFGYVVSTNAVLFSGFAVVSVLLILLACCYQAVTYGDDLLDENDNPLPKH